MTPRSNRTITLAFSALAALSFIGARGCVFDGDVSLGDDGQAGLPAAGAGGSGHTSAGKGGSGTTTGGSGRSSAGKAAGGIGGGSISQGSGGTGPSASGGSAPGAAGEAGSPPSTGGAMSMGSGGEPSATGGTGNTTSTGGTGGDAGSGPIVPATPPRSCVDFTGAECNGSDCCETPGVPGGTAVVDGVERTYRPFAMNRFEVTVRRFRTFLNAVEDWEAEGNPVEGAGAHPDVPESGFRRVWIENFPDGIVEGLTPTWLGWPSWKDEPGGGATPANPNYVIEGSDELAVNWVPFHVAFAFCIWDGGRLPSRAEWLYAARGGAEQTRFPWGDSPPVNEMFADIPEPEVRTPYSDPLWWVVAVPVGSHPASANRFGHEDLYAGLWEFMRDTNVVSGEVASGAAIELIGDHEVEILLTTRRTATGGDWAQPAGTYVLPTHQIGSSSVGFRCVHDVP